AGDGPARSGVVDVPGLVRQLFPSAAVAGAAVTFATHPEFLSRPDHHHGWLLVVVGLVVIVRQVVLVADHTALATGLSEAVEHRTHELRHREQWWRDIVQNLTDVVIVADRDGTIAYCSPAVDSTLGHMPALASTVELLDQVHPDETDAVAAELAEVVAGDRAHGFVECRIRRADGSYGWFEVDAVGQLSGRALDGAVLTLHDVSERRELTDRLHRRAYHDMLTGLPNRALLLQRIQQTLLRRPRRAFALLLLDLDDFKIINDRHGHAAGDIVLTVIAERLAALTDAGDTVARLGGDEFAHLVHGSPDQVRALAERLVRAIEQPVVAGGRRFHVRTSIGVVLAADDGSETAQVLLSHADIALYEAKGRDKGGVVVLEGDSRAHAASQVLLREQIAQPDLSQFPLVYQPIVDLATGEMRGAEALLRWQHPVLGAVPPEVFVPLAEAGGSIQLLGWHVLGLACTQLATWQREVPDRRFAIGVNVSVRQLDEPGFADRVADLVTAHGIAPDQLVVELTEQALAVDFETAVAVVAELRAIGVSVAVDDYGTGYSSLRYLDRFDADVVKIDRSFVANVVDSGHTQKIVRSVMHMARSLDLQSIAEGIETVEQLAVVQALGCELGQGFLFSRPVSSEGMTRMMLEPPRWPGFEPGVLVASG
ncbi:MAG: EAL domain-containing protein, partial [Nocardioidaceae bacterium]